MMSLITALTAAGAFLGALVTALVVRPITASTASTVVLPAAVAVVTFLSVFVVLARGRERSAAYIRNSSAGDVRFHSSLAEATGSSPPRPAELRIPPSLHQPGPSPSRT